MRPPVSRLHDPRLRHERMIAERIGGVRSPRSLLDGIEATLAEHRVPDARAPRLTGSAHDGELAYRIAAVIAGHGLAVDDSEDLPDEHEPYENNAGLLFRGAAPSIAAGASSVVGAGGSFSLTLTDATDNSGRIVLVTGNSPNPSAAGVVGTITFAVSKPNGDYMVWLAPGDADAADRPAYSDFGGRSTTAFTFAVRATLSGNTSYHWEFGVIERESI
jgi:hypothetical protein